MIVNNFWREGNFLYLDLGEDIDTSHIVAIDSEGTWHSRSYSPLEVETLGIEEDYLFFTEDYRSGDPIDLENAVAAYNEKHSDSCGNSENGRQASIDDIIFIADVYDDEYNDEIAYIEDWEPFYDYLMSLFNKCDCAKCQPPLELITAILAYYDMQLSLKTFNTGRFLKMWFKTMSNYNNVRSGCGCNDR